MGQSVTIPDCKVVVDFLEEMKPVSGLEIGDDSILYDNKLTRRIVDEHTAKQRKGRTGRTNPGWYVTPRGCRPMASHPIDASTIGQALLRLSMLGTFSLSREI